jgi:DNA primase
MDVIQAHQSGFTNVVAIMGTSLTGKQLDLAKKYTKKYVLALDSDAAGAEATRRSLEGAWDLFNSEIIRLRGVSTPVNVKREIPDIKIANLGTGKDPDEVIRDDSESWRSIVLEAQPLLDYLISWEVDQQGSLDSESKLAIVERIFPLIGRLDNPFEQEAAFSKLARSLGETEKTLEIAAGRPPSKNRRASPRRTAAEDNKGVTFIEGDPTEDHLLGIVLVYGEKAWDLWESLDIPALPSECFRNPENAELWKIMTSGQPVEEAEAIVSGLAEQLRSKLVMKLDEKKLGRALGDMVKRLLERQIKSQEEEAALAISSSLEEDGVANLVPPEDIRQQFVNRIEQLRKLERSRWGRPLSGT